MAESKMLFDKFIAEEVMKYKGISYPVKTGAVKRMLTRKASVFDLHPNPDDEFCLPEIGPNYQIISSYRQRFLDAIKNSDYYYGDDEPIIVERMHPEGYMILNGHHRWAAAMMIGQSEIPVQIVNLTHEADIKAMLKNSQHDKRVTFDLDEVVFCREGDEICEEPLPFPYSRYFKKRLRLGIPALFRFFNKQGYDIWVYTSQYSSFDHIHDYFLKYDTKVSGIVTGTARKIQGKDQKRKAIEAMIADHYQYTVHIDNEMLLRTSKETKAFDEYALSGSYADWSREVMEVISSLEKTE